MCLFSGEFGPDVVDDCLRSGVDPHLPRPGRKCKWPSVRTVNQATSPLSTEGAVRRWGTDLSKRAAADP